MDLGRPAAFSSAALANASANSLTIRYGVDKTLTVERNSREFHVDGMPGKFESAISQALLLMAIEKSPKVVTTDELEQALGQRQFAKYVSMTHRDLRQAGVLVTVIDNVRSRGYRLAPGWSVRHVSRSVLGEALQQIQSVVEAACAHAMDCPISRSDIQLLHLERNLATRALAGQNFVMLNDAGWQIVHELGRLGLRQEHAPDIIEVKGLVERLLSYVQFWRIGHRLSAEDWRRDFVAEVRGVLSRLEQEVERLHRLGVPTAA